MLRYTQGASGRHVVLARHVGLRPENIELSFLLWVVALHGRGKNEMVVSSYGLNTSASAARLINESLCSVALRVDFGEDPAALYETVFWVCSKRRSIETCAIQLRALQFLHQVYAWSSEGCHFYP